MASGVFFNRNERQRYHDLNCGTVSEICRMCLDRTNNIRCRRILVSRRMLVGKTASGPCQDHVYLRKQVQLRERRSKDFPPHSKVAHPFPSSSDNLHSTPSPSPLQTQLSDPISLTPPAAPSPHTANTDSHYSLSLSTKSLYSVLKPKVCRRHVCMIGRARRTLCSSQFRT